MSSLKNFGLKSMAIEEWIPWGGIVHPNVVRQKDGSLFGVIRYEPYNDDLEKSIEFEEFRRGWVIWVEHQHHSDDNHDEDFLVLCWNPWYSAERLAVGNSLGKKKISKNRTVEYFATVLQDFVKAIQNVTMASLLEYQEIIDFLSFSLSMGEEHIEMPEIPLYLDALLSQDLNFKFGANSITLNGKHIVVLSLPEMNDPNEVFAYVHRLDYRYVRRILLFNEREAKRDFYTYVQHWCPGRKNIRRMELDGILGTCNGYYQENFFFLVYDEDYAEFLEFLNETLTNMNVIYRIESFNLKETFWGSIPGLFLANAKPPIIGFHSLDEILLRNHVVHKEEHRKFENLVNKFDADGNLVEEETPQEPERKFKRLSSMSDADLKDNIKGDIAKQQSGYSNLAEIQKKN